MVGVDGWARIINENKRFDGMDFEQDAESCTCVSTARTAAHPIKVTEWLSECKREPSLGSRTRAVLRHKAVIQCARLAFGFTGIFDEDEAQRIVEKDVTPQAAGEPDITPAIEAIDNAGAMEELQAAFKAAWNRRPSARPRPDCDLQRAQGAQRANRRRICGGRSWISRAMSGSRHAWAR